LRQFFKDKVDYEIPLRIEPKFFSIAEF